MGYYFADGQSSEFSFSQMGNPDMHRSLLRLYFAFLFLRTGTSQQKLQKLDPSKFSHYTDVRGGVSEEECYPECTDTSPTAYEKWGGSDNLGYEHMH